MQHIFDRQRPEVVVHCAASYKDPNAWRQDIETNVKGSALVAKLSQEYHVRRVIYFQTALRYGLNWGSQPVPVDMPIKPEGSSYAFSKVAGAQYLSMMDGPELVTLVLANAYGPRNLSGPVPTFYQRITQGKQCFVVQTKRDFVYGADVVALAFRVVKGEQRSLC
jgi:UDP-glucose 4-epimerase